MQQAPPGVGATTSPLLITATTGNTASTNAAVTDLSQVTQTSNTVQQSHSENGTSSYSAGPTVPIFDPALSGDVGYLRRSDQTSLLNANSTSATSQSRPLDFVSTAVDFQ